MEDQFTYNYYEYQDHHGMPLKFLPEQHNSRSSHLIMNNNETVCTCTPSPTPAPTSATVQSSNTELLLSALRVYGLVLVVLFPMYCLLRKRCPRLYAVRQWVDEIKTPLAVTQFGYISWIWKVYSITSSADEELVEQIGLDALCLLRVLYLGFRLAAVGCFNSIWLFPVYLTAPSSKTEPDALNQVAINVLRQGSPRFLATVMGNYVFFGYFAYALLQEFKWFIHMRHSWLMRFNSRNYTVYVRNIPRAMRSAVALKQHFELLYGTGSVVQANMVLHVADFCAAVEKRKKIAAHLEHALAELAIHKKRPTHLAPKMEHESSDDGMHQTNGDDGTNDAASTGSGRRRLHFKVDAIDYYSDLLEKANDDVSRRLDDIARKNRPAGMMRNSLYSKKYHDLSFMVQQSAAPLMSSDMSVAAPMSDLSEDAVPANSEPTDEVVLEEDYPLVSPEGGSSLKSLSDSSRKVVVKSKRKLQKKASEMIKVRASAALELLDKAEGIADTVFKTVAEEGKPDDAAFVTFKSLVATHAAMQMSQHHVPFVMDTQVAPDIPEFIFWNNVGADKEMIQTGQLVSAALTVAVCLFWTIPVSAIVNLTNAQDLAKQFVELQPVFDNNPWLVTALSTLSPILLLLLNTGLLPIVLKAVSRVEFPPSDSQLEASAFWKMCAFHIIQTFFVSMVSSSLVQEISNILQDPTGVVYFLGKALPEQSAFFMQLLMVSTTMGVLIELFRMVPLFQAFVRSLLGWKLTEKERGQNIGMFKPVCVVDKFYYSRAQSRFCLYFLIMFTYNATSPLLNWFCLAFFLILGSVYRHQFIYNYPKVPDTGGEIWLYFIQVLLGCMIIAEVVLVGFLSLKEAPTALAVLVPLIVLSVLFIVYLEKQHFLIGHNLPARVALRKDLENDEQGADYSIFKEDYKNPALKERRLEPDWDSGKSEFLRQQGIQPPEDPEAPPAVTFTNSTKSAAQLSDTAFSENSAAADVVDNAPRTSCQRTMIEASAGRLETILSGDQDEDEGVGKSQDELDEVQDEDEGVGKSQDELDEEEKARGEEVITKLTRVFAGSF